MKTFDFIEKEKSFIHEIKRIFHNYLRVSFGEKNEK